MVTLLPWLLDFHGFSFTIFAGFPWFLCCHGCWYSMVTLLPWLRYKLTVEWLRNRGYVHDRAEFRVVYGLRDYQGRTEFLRVTHLTVAHMTDECNAA